LGAGTATVGEVACTLLTFAQSVLAADEMLHFTWTTNSGHSGSDTFAPRPYKDYDLRPSGLNAQTSGNQITLSATSLALFVAVEADISGRFDKNAFTLLPGQQVSVTFLPTNPDDTPTFTLRDLHSATYA
jgi:beta-mannosidase